MVINQVKNPTVNLERKSESRRIRSKSINFYDYDPSTTKKSYMIDRDYSPYDYRHMVKFSP